MAYALRLLGIHKRYRVGLGSCRATVDALRGVTLHVRADEIVVIVGRPGSGKSTLLRCAAGLLRPDRGRVRWFDQRPPPGGRPAGVLYRSVPSHYGCMTVTESLAHAMLHRDITPQPPAVHRALERVGMASEGSVRLARLGAGQLRRVALAHRAGGKLFAQPRRRGAHAAPLTLHRGRSSFRKMAEFSLYNTMSRRIEPFAPADGTTVRMYTCGPTVYNPAHIGNFRTFLFEDLLRRTLRLRGWQVRQVMNLTDLDDKIIKKAAEQGITIKEVTEPVTEIFHRDRRYLRIEDAEVYPKATEHVPEMIALVERLLERGLAYIADDRSIYFAIAKFPAYGRLSRLDSRSIKPGARVAADDYNKEDVRDFALWKAAKPEDERTGAAWDSPWGRGRPGWHLECSAMAMKYLGETLDLHCGGVDNIFPHHENEIGQSEGATGKEFSRAWCHGEFLLVEGSKMAKRVGNVVTVGTLSDQKIPGVAARHLM